MTRRGRSEIPSDLHPNTLAGLEEVKALVAAWVADGEIKLPEIENEPLRRDRGSPNFCIFHRHTRHSTSDYWTLKRIFRRKQHANELRVGQRDVH